MDFDAFTGGVEPGGLRTKNDIRILVCYILNSVKGPLSGVDIIKILQEKSLANYFEATDALSSLTAREHISLDEEGCYQILPTGREIAASLDITLPLSVRDKALEAAFTLLSEAKIQRENKVEIERTEFGYNVNCHISGGDFDLMRFTIYVPDLFQARMVKKNFHRDPEGLYKLFLTSITGNRDLAKSFQEE